MPCAHGARGAAHLAREDLRVGVLRLDEQLDALDRRSRSLGDSTSNATRAEINEELDNARLGRRRRSEMAAGRGELALVAKRVELAARTASTRMGQRTKFGTLRWHGTVARRAW